MLIMEREPAANDGRLKRVAKSLHRIFGEMINHAKQGDPNLGEGKLRGSLMPERYMDIPDYPPDDFQPKPPTEDSE